MKKCLIYRSPELDQVIKTELLLSQFSSYSLGSLNWKPRKTLNFRSSLNTFKQILANVCFQLPVVLFFSSNWSILWYISQLPGEMYLQWEVDVLGCFFVECLYLHSDWKFDGEVEWRSVLTLTMFSFLENIPLDQGTLWTISGVAENPVGGRSGKDLLIQTLAVIT